MNSITTGSEGSVGINKFIFQNYTKVGLKGYDLTVTKSWDDDNDRDGKRRTIESISFAVLENGVPNGETLTIYPETLEDGTVIWEGTYTIRSYTDSNGNEIEFSFQELAITDGEGNVIPYESDMEVSGQTYHFTNTYEPERIDIAGVKTWVNDDPENRPESIIVVLYANGKEKQRKAVRPDAEGNWPWVFTNLYKYEDGELIDYSVKEILSGSGLSYTYQEVGYDLVNTYHPYGDLYVDKDFSNPERVKIRVV